MLRNAILKTVLALSLVLAVAACESSEERAEKHFQAALALIAKGDTERATVEFRNVFKLNKRHAEAHRAFAEMLAKSGREDAALREYMRLLELVPEDAEGNIAAAELAIATQNWPEARRYGEKAQAVAPEDLRSKVIGLNLQYAQAIEKQDDAAARKVAAEARTMAAEQPGVLSLHRILIDAAVRAQDPATALTEAETALKLAPDDRMLWNTRLQLLVQLKRYDEVETLLQQMLEKFPEDDELKSAMVRFYIGRQQPEKAETFLRELASKSEGKDRLGYEATLVQLVRARRGVEAATAEIDGLIAAGGDPVTLGALRAGLRFEAGDRDAAIADMQKLIDGAEPSEETRRVKVALAKMLVATGNQVRARRLVEEVLAEDAGQVDAMKMKANWLIEEDKTDDAIALLRTALDRNPDDVEALALSADAHERNGDHDLAMNFLSLSVEASKSAPGPSIRYATALMKDKRLMPAEDVLVKALRMSPQNIELLARLGQLYVDMQDWPRTEQVERSLRDAADPNGAKMADALEARRLAQQGDTGESLAVLERLAQDDGSLAARIAVIRARFAAGDREGALSYARELAAAQPDDDNLRYMLATVEAATGDTAAATAAFRGLVDKNPQAVPAWMGLIRVLAAAGDAAGARATVDKALEQLPESPDLLWAKAGMLEKAGDIDGALALNETLYKLAPNSPIAANNLASMLASYRDDETSLDRAWQVVRRLKGTAVPAFQDTYGWIAYRRGDAKEAVGYLEPAAKGLAGDPMVQLHLGLVYLALERQPEALAQLQKAVEIAGDGDTRPQIEQARAEIAKLEAAGVTAAAPGAAPTPAPGATPAPAPAGEGGSTGD